MAAKTINKEHLKRVEFAKKIAGDHAEVILDKLRRKGGVQVAATKSSYTVAFEDGGTTHYSAVGKTLRGAITKVVRAWRDAAKSPTAS